MPLLWMWIQLCGGLPPVCTTHHRSITHTHAHLRARAPPPILLPLLLLHPELCSAVTVELSGEESGLSILSPTMLTSPGEWLPREGVECALFRRPIAIDLTNAALPPELRSVVRVELLRLARGGRGAPGVCRKAGGNATPLAAFLPMRLARGGRGAPGVRREAGGNAAPLAAFLPMRRVCDVYLLARPDDPRDQGHSHPFQSQSAVRG